MLTSLSRASALSVILWATLDNQLHALYLLSKHSLLKIKLASKSLVIHIAKVSSLLFVLKQEMSCFDLFTRPKFILPETRVATEDRAL
jgi:hypothetical protein